MCLSTILCRWSKILIYLHVGPVRLHVDQRGGHHGVGLRAVAALRGFLLPDVPRHHAHLRRPRTHLPPRPPKLHWYEVNNADDGKRYDLSSRNDDLSCHFFTGPGLTRAKALRQVDSTDLWGHVLIRRSLVDNAYVLWYDPFTSKALFVENIG